MDLCNLWLWKIHGKSMLKRGDTPIWIRECIFTFLRLWRCLACMPWGKPLRKISVWNNYWVHVQQWESFNLPRQKWSLLNRFRMEQGHCGACRRKWRLTDTDLCPCGETQTVSHIVESCPLTKLNGGLSRLHSADEDTVSWLTNYG